MAQFSKAAEVREIARGLIPEHHPHLEGVRVEYLFSDTIPKRNGKQVWGTCRLISSLAAFLAGRMDDDDLSMGGFVDVGLRGEKFFAITITEPVWRKLKDAEKVALVDHELCHAWREDELDEDGAIVATKLSIAPHDLEEFCAVVARHGLWRKDVEQFHAIAAAAQLALPLEPSREMREFAAKYQATVSEAEDGTPVINCQVPPNKLGRKRAAEVPAAAVTN